MVLEPALAPGPRGGDEPSVKGGRGVLCGPRWPVLELRGEAGVGFARREGMLERTESSAVCCCLRLINWGGRDPWVMDELGREGDDGVVDIGWDEAVELWVDGEDWAFE